MKRVLLSSVANAPPHGRGLFSYFYQAIWNIIRIEKAFNTEEVLLYVQINDRHYYKQENIWDICFEQNVKDFIKNKNKYEIIKEDTTKSPYPYDNIPNCSRFLKKIGEFSYLTQKHRSQANKIIQNYFKLKKTYLDEINSKISLFNVSKALGIHRRATDSLGTRHNRDKIKGLKSYFEYIDNHNYEHIFLMCDNEPDINAFKQKYGDKIICFEDENTSKDEKIPFFKNGQDSAGMKKHIEQMIINTYILSKTSKLLCTNSNLSVFASLLNPNLKFEIAN